MKLIRDDEQLQAWERGHVQVVLADGRLHLIYGLVLNVSIPVDALEFHGGGGIPDLLHALRSLSVELPAEAVASIAAHPLAQRAGYPVVNPYGALEDTPATFPADFV